MGAVAYGSQILSEPQYSRSEPYQAVFEQFVTWHTTTIKPAGLTVTNAEPENDLSEQDMNRE